jgi:hypothetical protein
MSGSDEDFCSESPTSDGYFSHCAAWRIWTVLRFPIHLPILIVSTREEQMFVPCPT